MSKKIEETLRKALKTPAKSHPLLVMQKSGDLVKLRDQANMLLGKPTVRRFKDFTDAEISTLQNHAIEAHKQFYKSERYNKGEQLLHEKLMKELLDEKSRRRNYD